MNVDQFAHCARLIADNLNRIVEHDELSWGRPNLLSDPRFREVVSAQQHLLNATEELLGMSAKN